MVENMIEDLLKGKVQSLTPEFVVHLWLSLFMTGVGLMKASGLLKHDLSRIVGVLEAIGGAVFLNPLMHNFFYYLIGSAICLVALGIVISVPNKRKSPVCWIHAALILYFLRGLSLPADALLPGAISGDSLATAGVLPLGLGIGIGAILRAASKTKTS